jgi:type II secretory pathway pseudopilin PulG
VDTQTLLIVIAISALVLVAGLIIAFRRLARIRIDKRVEAAITQIQVQASTMSSWWIVTAQWTDPGTGRILIFRSHHINFPPHHRVGERIVVNFDANEPRHYRMEL